MARAAMLAKRGEASERRLVLESRLLARRADQDGVAARDEVAARAVGDVLNAVTAPAGAADLAPDEPGRDAAGRASAGPRARRQSTRRDGEVAAARSGSARSADRRRSRALRPATRLMAGVWRDRALERIHQDEVVDRAVDADGAARPDGRRRRARARQGRRSSSHSAPPGAAASQRMAASLVGERAAGSRRDPAGRRSRCARGAPRGSRDRSRARRSRAPSICGGSSSTDGASMPAAAREAAPGRGVSRMIDGETAARGLEREVSPAMPPPRTRSPRSCVMSGAPSCGRRAHVRNLTPGRGGFQGERRDGDETHGLSARVRGVRPVRETVPCFAPSS